MLRGNSIFLILVIFLITFYQAFAKDSPDKDVIDDYGPITICADKLDYDGKKRTLTYLGKVFVMQAWKQNILCEDFNKVNENTSNTVYFGKYEDKSFTETQNLWLEKAKTICEKTKECNFITGQSLVVKLDKNRKVETITVTVDKNSDNFAKFYSYPLDENKGNKGYQKTFKGIIGGHGKKIIYSIINKKMILKDKAFVTQNGNDYAGDEIDYDLAHDLIAVPGSKVSKRSTIVLEGVSDETKVKLGNAFKVNNQSIREFTNANQVY